jgi:hypothetical protein
MPTLIKNQVYKAKKSNTVLGYRKKAKRKLKAKVFATEKQKLIKKGITSSLQEVSGARSKERGKSSAVHLGKSNHLSQKKRKNRASHQWSPRENDHLS